LAVGLFGEPVVDEIVELRRRGFRFVALADDNFYPVTLVDLAIAERQRHVARLEQLRALRAERFELMDRLARLPSDMVSCCEQRERPFRAMIRPWKIPTWQSLHIVLGGC